jgi:hypothetical protein
MILLKVADCDGKYDKSQSSINVINICDFLCGARSHLVLRSETKHWTLSPPATSGVKIAVTVLRTRGRG